MPICLCRKFCKHSSNCYMVVELRLPSSKLKWGGLNTQPFHSRIFFPNIQTPFKSKFRYSEKTALFWSYKVISKKGWIFFRILCGFSQYLNFSPICFIWNILFIKKIRDIFEFFWQILWKQPIFMKVEVLIEGHKI